MITSLDSSAQRSLCYILVWNKDSTLARGFRITPAEHVELRQRWRTPAERMTAQEVLDGCFVTMYGRGMEPGQYSVSKDGTIRIKLATATDYSREYMIELKRGEYSGTLPNITVAPAVLSGMRGPLTVDSVVNGVVTWR